MSEPKETMMAMTKLQARRLMNVARALRESPAPQDFGMENYQNPCGTPGCALGHYGARRDLQKMFTLGPDHLLHHRGEEGDHTPFFDDAVLRHFGIHDSYEKGRSEATELFSGHGCGHAQTPGQAARYIERFVMERIGPRFRKETGETSKKALRRWLGMNWQPGLLPRARRARGAA